MRLGKKQVPYINYPHTHLESWAMGKVDALTNTRHRRDTAARCTHPSPSPHSPLAAPRASSSLCLHHRREALSDSLRLSSLILASAQNPLVQDRKRQRTQTLSSRIFRTARILSISTCGLPPTFSWNFLMHCETSDVFVEGLPVTLIDIALYSLSHIFWRILRDSSI